MFKKIILALIALSFIGGCARINPRLKEKIDNRDGKIDGDIRNNQNGVMAEIGKLQQESAIHDSQIKEMQQGLLNLNVALSRNENSGYQILQGDGPLVLVFGLGTVGMILYYFRNKQKSAEKTSEIMASEIARFRNPVLEDNVMRAAMHTPSEEQVYQLLKKHRNG